MALAASTSQKPRGFLLLQLVGQFKLVRVQLGQSVLLSIHEVNSDDFEYRRDSHSVVLFQGEEEDEAEEPRPESESADSDELDSELVEPPCVEYAKLPVEETDREQ